MSNLPTKLERVGDDGLKIEWSNGKTRLYSVNELREKCPCATCREKRNAPPPDPMQLNILEPAEAQPTRIEGMKPVGNYAYSIAFNDGHDTGIFTFEFLQTLGKEGWRGS